MALPIVAVYAHHESQTCEDIEGDADNRHPSGNDRLRIRQSGSQPSGDNAQSQAGGARIQGDAQNDPDDDGRGPDRSNGGLDVAAGPGGGDRADQDGNNGCGDDDDFEDDNEGLCLRRQGAGNAGAPGFVSEAEISTRNGRVAVENQSRRGAGLGEGAELRSRGFNKTRTDVLGEGFARAIVPTVVLGVEFVRGQVMAVTGGPFGILALGALTLIATGLVLRTASRKDISGAPR